MLCGVVGCVVLVKRRGGEGGLGGVQCWVWFEVHCVVRVGVRFFNFLLYHLP